MGMLHLDHVTIMDQSEQSTLDLVQAICGSDSEVRIVPCVTVQPMKVRVNPSSYIFQNCSYVHLCVI